MHFLLPCADLADKKLAGGLEDLGGIVDAIDAYATVPETEDRAGQRAKLLAEGAGVITFTSSSTVTNFCSLVVVPALREKFPKLKFVSIGPATSKTAVERGLEVATEAEVHSIPGLVEAVRQLQ